VLCDRQGAVRCLLDAALDCGSGRHKRATQTNFNPATRIAPERRALAASGIVAAFKHLWSDSWGARALSISFSRRRRARFARARNPDRSRTPLHRRSLPRPYRQPGKRSRNPALLAGGVFRATPNRYAQTRSRQSSTRSARSPPHPLAAHPRAGRAAGSTYHSR